MPIPPYTLTPPFNIVRCSHIELGAGDLERSRAFYEETLGLVLSERTAEALYFRGLEERNHHSFVLRRSHRPECLALGLKVASEEDLDRAEHFFRSRSLPARFVERPFQGRTLSAADPHGMPLELVFRFDQAERLLQRYGAYRGPHPQRIDHFNCFSPDVEASVDFYSALGFRVTEYTADEASGSVWAAWMHRKGNVHDLAFTNGTGPRLHHAAIWLPTVLNVIHLCDVMSTTGYLANMERGPGRHGISNAFFLYVRDPDGHRIELYTSDYLTADPDLEPIRWGLKDTQRQTLWGTPAPRSWFEEGTAFPGIATRKPALTAQPIVAR